jgi:agmatine deiminase
VRKIIVTLWLALFALAACTDPSTGGVTLLDQGGELQFETPKNSSDGTMLPVYMSEAEQENKADWWAADPRERYPSYYGFTDAPADPGVLPGEFEDVEELLIAWADAAWSLGTFYVRLVDAAAWRVPVTIIISSSSDANYLREAFTERDMNVDNISFLVSDLDSIWIRDYGPLAVRRRDGTMRYLDGRYYFGRWYDDVFPTLLANHRSTPVSRPPLEMEGGNLQSDGAGRCITTEYLIEQNSGFGYDADDVRQVLRNYFGCQQTVFLPTMDGEGTGHVDMAATITAPGEVVVGYYPSGEDYRNAPRLDEAAARLERAGFVVRRIPMPDNSGRRVFRSYTNGLAVDGALLMPVYDYDRRYEDEAVAVYSAAYPGRDIVPIDSESIIHWAGAIHCVTMTMAQ